MDSARARKVGTGAAAAGVALATLLLWGTPAVYPIQLLVVYVHECGHTLAALLTGGTPHELVISPDLSGHVTSTGGSSFVVASAGYLSSVAFGGVLTVMAADRAVARVGLGVVGAALALMALLFARPFFGWALPTGLLTGAILVAISRSAPPAVSRAVLFYLALVSTCYALLDLRTDLFSTPADVLTDARILAATTGIPALIWSLLWSGAALVILVVTLRLAVRRWS